MAPITYQLGEQACDENVQDDMNADKSESIDDENQVNNESDTDEESDPANNNDGEKTSEHEFDMDEDSEEDHMKKVKDDKEVDLEETEKEEKSGESDNDKDSDLEETEKEEESGESDNDKDSDLEETEREEESGESDNGKMGQSVKRTSRDGELDETGELEKNNKTGDDLAGKGSNNVETEAEVFLSDKEVVPFIEKTEKLDLAFIQHEFELGCPKFKEQGINPSHLPLQIIATVLLKLKVHEWKLLACWTTNTKKDTNEPIEDLKAIKALKTKLKWGQVKDMLFPPRYQDNEDFRKWRAETRKSREKEANTAGRVEEIVSRYIKNKTVHNVAAAFYYKLFKLKFGYGIDDSLLGSTLLNRAKSVFEVSRKKNVWKQNLALPEKSRFGFEKLYPRAFNLAFDGTQSVPPVFAMDAAEQDFEVTVASVENKIMLLNEEDEVLDADIIRSRTNLKNYREKKRDIRERARTLNGKMIELQQQHRFLNVARTKFGNHMESLAKTEMLVNTLGNIQEPNFAKIIAGMCKILNVDIMVAVQQIQSLNPVLHQNQQMLSHIDDEKSIGVPATENPDAEAKRNADAVDALLKSIEMDAHVVQDNISEDANDESPMRANIQSSEEILEAVENLNKYMDNDEQDAEIAATNLQNHNSAQLRKLGEVLRHPRMSSNIQPEIPHRQSLHLEGEKHPGYSTAAVSIPSTSAPPGVGVISIRRKSRSEVHKPKNGKKRRKDKD